MYNYESIYLIYDEQMKKNEMYIKPQVNREIKKLFFEL